MLIAVEPAPACGELAGTTSGYRRHVAAGDGKCRPCLDAMAACKRKWWQGSPGAQEASRARVRVRSRALERLAREHRARFLALLDEETRKDAACAG